jgi:hypothetical protein
VGCSRSLAEASSQFLELRASACEPALAVPADGPAYFQSAARGGWCRRSRCCCRLRSRQSTWRETRNMSNGDGSGDAAADNKGVQLLPVTELMSGTAPCRLPAGVHSAGLWLPCNRTLAVQNSSFSAQLGAPPVQARLSTDSR